MFCVSVSLLRIFADLYRNEGSYVIGEEFQVQVTSIKLVAKIIQ